MTRLARLRERLSLWLFGPKQPTFPQTAEGFEQYLEWTARHGRVPAVRLAAAQTLERRSKERAHELLVRRLVREELTRQMETILGQFVREHVDRILKEQTTHAKMPRLRHHHDED